MNKLDQLLDAILQWNEENPSDEDDEPEFVTLAKEMKNDKLKYIQFYECEICQVTWSNLTSAQEKEVVNCPGCSKLVEPFQIVEETK